jgi:hypothetical protein
MHVPSGLESIPGCQRLSMPPRPAVPGPPDVDLFGMTPGEAIERLMQIDPRFRMLRDDGVVVVRPAAAWDDRKHFMHQPLDALRFTDNNYIGALNAFEVIAFRPPWRANPDAWRAAPEKTPDGGRLFSVDIAAPTGLIAANAIVREHGALRWSLGYCLPEARPKYATFALYTLDGAGGGFHLALLRDADGKLRDACPRLPARPARSRQQ